jgi:hypothetical protein
MQQRRREVALFQLTASSSQLQRGLYAEKGSDEAMTWISLAASKGVPVAELVLGGLCHETKLWFGTIY